MVYVFTHVPPRSHTHTHMYIQHTSDFDWLILNGLWIDVIQAVTATTNIGIVLRSGRRSFDQNTGATAVIYNVLTVQFMIISKQDMTYIVVFSMHQMPAAFWGLKT